jgi:hypothetical protein
MTILLAMVVPATEGAEVGRNQQSLIRVQVMEDGDTILTKDSANIGVNFDEAEFQDPDPNAGIDTSKYPNPHTWGEKDKNIMGLPSWAAVLIGGVVAALIVVCTNAVGDRLAHPLPFFATEEQRVKDQIERAREKVRLLESALEEKREKDRLEAEAEARRAAGEPELSKQPDDDELVGEVLYRTQQVQRNAVGALNDSIKQSAPMIARASHVQEVFEHNVQTVKDRASDMALRELGSMYHQMKAVAGGEDLTEDVSGYDLPNWFTLDDDNDTDPPPFALLIGGMFAPAQIKAIRSNCNMQILWNSTILAICAACSVMDMHHTCDDIHVKIWFFGVLTINLLDVLCNAFIASKCATQLGTLQEDEDSMSRIRPTGNSIWDLYINLQANSGQFFKGYFAYQSIIDGAIYTIQKGFSFFSLFWGFYGVYLSISHVLTDTLSCDAKVAVWFMHTYSFLFLMLVTWTLLGLTIWVLQKLSHSTMVTAPLMKAAKQSDEEVPFQLPLFQILTRSFVLRDSSTMLHIKAKNVDQDVMQMEAELEDTKQRLQERKHYLDQIEDCRVGAVLKEADLIDKYKIRVREMGGTLPDDYDAAESTQRSEAGEAGSSSAAFAQQRQQRQSVVSFADQVRQNFEAASAGVNMEDVSAVQSDLRAAAGLAGSQAQLFAQQAQSAAQSAASSAQAAVTSTVENTMRQPLLQGETVMTEPEASASSSGSPETQQAQDTENEFQSF